MGLFKKMTDYLLMGGNIRAIKKITKITVQTIARGAALVTNWHRPECA